MTEYQLSEYIAAVKEVGSLKAERDHLADENARLRLFAMQLAERIYLAFEIFAIKAERKTGR